MSEAVRQRRATRFEHQAEIVTVYGYVSFATARDELAGWLDDLAWTSGDGLRALFHHTGMEDTLGALGLVLNCVTLWNTVYLDRALTQLRAAGYPALDADVARLSAYLRRHINIHGHYTVALPDLGGRHRVLRDPDQHDSGDEEE